MAPRASHLFEEPLSLGHEWGVFESLDVQMTGGTTGLHLRPSKQRMLPVLSLRYAVALAIMSLLGAVDRRSLPRMSWCTTELLGRMGFVRQKDLAPRVSLKGVRLVFKARAIDSTVAALASIHTGRGLGKIIAVEFGQNGLLNRRDLR